MKLHLVMPMGGIGKRFSDGGYELPKPLIEIHGKPFFYWAVRSIQKFIKLKDLTFIVLSQHVEQFEIDKKIKQFFPYSNIVVIDYKEVMGGPVATCLKSELLVNDNDGVIFNDCDHMFTCKNFYRLINSDLLECDAALLTFFSQEKQFSYVKFNDGRVIGTIEKEVASNNAICGAYYFRSFNIFKNAANDYLKKCNYGEFFISGVYNVLCEKGFFVKVFDVDFHTSFGTPEEYKNAVKSPHFQDLD